VTAPFALKSSPTALLLELGLVVFLLVDAGFLEQRIERRLAVSDEPLPAFFADRAWLGLGGVLAGGVVGVLLIALALGLALVLVTDSPASSPPRRGILSSIAGAAILGLRFRGRLGRCDLDRGWRCLRGHPPLPSTSPESTPLAALESESVLLTLR